MEVEVIWYVLVFQDLLSRLCKASGPRTIFESELQLQYKQLHKRLYSDFTGSIYFIVFRTESYCKAF